MKVALVGYGTMGQIVEKKLLEKGHEVVGIISLGMDEDLELIQKPFDVIIDFSHPSFLNMTSSYVKKHNTPLVVATTGYSAEQICAIKECAKEHPIVYTANFSLGITVFEEVLKQITPILKESFDIEVIEKHHNKKFDAPSGTAKMLVEAIDPEHDYVSSEIPNKSGDKMVKNMINMETLSKVLLQRFPHIYQAKAEIVQKHEMIYPFACWEAGICKLSWWETHNRVKHYRHNHFNEATLENALNSVAALIILNSYLYELVCETHAPRMSKIGMLDNCYSYCGLVVEPTERLPDM